jgi:uncharacterized GH25 family protein
VDKDYLPSSDDSDTDSKADDLDTNLRKARERLNIIPLDNNEVSKFKKNPLFGKTLENTDKPVEEKKPFQF